MLSLRMKPHVWTEIPYLKGQLLIWTLTQVQGPSWWWPKCRITQVTTGDSSEEESGVGPCSPEPFQLGDFLSALGQGSQGGSRL